MVGLSNILCPTPLTHKDLNKHFFFLLVIYLFLTIPVIKNVVILIEKLPFY